MSRVSYVMMNPGGERELTAVVRRAIDELIGELVAAAGTDRDRVLEVVLVGNPIMHHLVLGIDPTPLGSAPFTLATADPVSGPAADLDLDLPHGRFWTGPCIAGHVGADTTAAILAEGPHRSEGMQLLVDIGTNAEIVLGDRHRQYAASSPTGPAFEGAQISAGQRATAGAIERVRIDRQTLEPRFRVIGVDAWSRRAGVRRRARSRASAARGSSTSSPSCSSPASSIATARSAPPARDRVVARRAHVRLPPPRRHPDHAERRPGDPARQGRAACRHRAAAGPCRPTGRRPTSASPVRSARTSIRCGRWSSASCPTAPSTGCGRSGTPPAPAPCRRCCPERHEPSWSQAAAEVIKIETATEPRFQELFVAAMAFPHASAPTPHLAEVIDLPVVAPAPTTGRRRRSRA